MAEKGQLIFALLIVAVLAVLGYRAFSGGGGTQTYELQYRPADFKLELDEETALAVLQNPRRYRREFDELVHEVNSGILRHLANRMGLTDSLRRAAQLEYDRQHPQIADLYYQDFMRLRDTSAVLYETWYDEGGRKVTEVFEEVASSYTCFMVNKVLAAVLRTDDGLILASGTEVDNPCRIATGEALRPLVAQLRERAAIDDFGRSRGLFRERAENLIGELATIEVRDRKGLSKQLQTTIWGYSLSETDVEITALSILKMGFRLDNYFDIRLDEQNQRVSILLPEPEILSHEVLPKVEKLDIGWLREVEGANLNEGVNTLREAFREDARESNISSRAKERARELMEMMFGPVVASLGGEYALVVEFRGGAADRIVE